MILNENLVKVGQYWFINYNKYTTQVQHVNNKGNWVWGNENSLY